MPVSDVVSEARDRCTTTETSSTDSLTLDLHKQLRLRQLRHAMPFFTRGRRTLADAHPHNDDADQLLVHTQVRIHCEHRCMNIARTIPAGVSNDVMDDDLWKMTVPAQDVFGGGGGGSSVVF